MLVGQTVGVLPKAEEGKVIVLKKPDVSLAVRLDALYFATFNPPVSTWV